MENSVKLEAIDLAIMEKMVNTYQTIDTLAKTIDEPRIRISISINKLLELRIIQKENPSSLANSIKEPCYIIKGNVNATDYIDSENYREYVRRTIDEMLKKHTNGTNIYFTAVKLSQSKLSLVDSIIKDLQDDLNALESDDAEEEIKFFVLFNSKKQTAKSQ